MAVIILSIMVLGVVVGLAYRELTWGVAVVLLLLPAYGISWSVGGVAITLLELAIWAVTAVWVVRLLQGRITFPRRNGWWYSGGALLIAATVGLIIAPQFTKGVAVWLAYFVTPALFFLVFTSVVKTTDHLVWPLRAVGITALVIGGFAVIQRLTNGWLVPDAYWLEGEGHRVTSFYSYANAVGLYLAPITVVLVAWLAQRVRQLAHTKVAWIESGAIAATIIISIAAIIFAKSDGALVGLVAGLLFLGLSAKTTRVATGLVVVVGIMLLGAVGLPAAMVQTLTFADWSGQVRLTMWRETQALIADHWLLGVGLFGYPTALVPYHAATYLEIFWYPHNILFNFWVETGLLGVMAIGSMLGQIARAVWRCRHQVLAVGMAAMFITISVHGIVDVPYFKGDLAVLWWAGLGILTILSAPTYGEKSI